MLIGELQWGRTREGAETRPRPGDGRGRGGFNGAAPVKVRKRWFGRVPAGRDRGLQWGRTREGAETEKGERNNMNINWLQWGRTREGAETCRGSRRSPPDRGRFNGAAPVKVRKLLLSEVGAEAARAASMGPHP